MKIFRGQKYAYNYRLNAKTRLTMLCLSGFEICSRLVPLTGRNVCLLSGSEAKRCTINSCGAEPDFLLLPFPRLENFPPPAPQRF